MNPAATYSPGSEDQVPSAMWGLTSVFGIELDGAGSGRNGLLAVVGKDKSFLLEGEAVRVDPEAVVNEHHNL